MNCEQCMMMFKPGERSPYLFPQCQHSVCSQCINQQKELFDVENYISKCPICKKEGDPTFNKALDSLMPEYRKANTKIVKVCIFGNQQVGKTSVISRLADGSFSEVPKKSQVKYNTHDVTGKPVKFQLWDSVGQQRYRSIPTSIYKNCGIAILVYDAGKSKKSNDIDFWIEQFIENIAHKNVILVSNKTDKIANVTVSREHDTDCMSEIDVIGDECNERGWKHICVSAKQDQGFKALWSQMDTMSTGMNSMVSQALLNQQRNQNESKCAC